MSLSVSQYADTHAESFLAPFNMLTAIMLTVIMSCVAMQCQYVGCRYAESLIAVSVCCYRKSHYTDSP
jgi:hypothetical protein